MMKINNSLVDINSKLKRREVNTQRNEYNKQIDI